ncbi:MAG: tetratricopeptide repeat protein [Phycisphaerales bacterium]|nr:MAG: tetratricopeptide repeat protein [Phycisphaerales bacterium]
MGKPGESPPPAGGEQSSGPDPASGAREDASRSVDAKAAGKRGAKTIGICGAIFLVALIVRLVYLIESSESPTFEVPVVDAEVYDGLARSLIEGNGMGGAFFYQPFFYPFFLSVVYFFAGHSVLCAKVCQVVLGAATCVLTYRLGERVFDRRTGIIAGAIVALCGPLVFFEAELVGSGWAAFWSVALAWLFLKAGADQAPRSCRWLGICGALAVLTRPTFLPFFVAGCVWLAVALVRGSRRWRATSWSLANLLAGFAIIAIPVARLNSHVTGHFGILPSTGGINLYIGNNPDVCETLTTRPGFDWIRLTQLPLRQGVTGDQWEQQDFFARKFQTFVRTEPLGFAKGLARKALQFVSSREIPRNVDIYCFHEWSRVLGCLTWKVGGFGFPFGVILPLACIGFACRAREVPVPLILFLVLFPLSIVLVFVTARYRVVVVPHLAILAGAGFWAVVRMVQSRRWRRLTATAAGVVVLISLASVPGPFCEEKLDYTAELHFEVGTCLGAVTGSHGRPDEAIEHFRQVLRIDPGFADAHHNLALELEEQGNLDEAAYHYQEVLRLRPDRYDSLANLALVRERQGKPDQARRHFEQALRIEPTFCKGHYNYANLLLKQGELSRAIEHYEAALRDCPEYAKAQNNLKVALARREKLELALAQHTELLKRRPDHPTGYSNLVSLLVPLGRIDEAAERCSAALAADPQNTDARFALGFAYESAGRISEAIAEYQNVLQLRPDHAGARQRLEAAQAKLDDARSR